MNFNFKQMELNQCQITTNQSGPSLESYSFSFWRLLHCMVETEQVCGSVEKAGDGLHRRPDVDFA